MISGLSVVVQPPSMIRPTGKCSVSWENFCHARKASLAGPWPVGRPPFPMATRA